MNHGTVKDLLAPYALISLVTLVACAGEPGDAEPDPDHFPVILTLVP